MSHLARRVAKAVALLAPDVCYIRYEFGVPGFNAFGRRRLALNFLFAYASRGGRSAFNESRSCFKK